MCKLPALTFINLTFQPQDLFIFSLGSHNNRRQVTKYYPPDNYKENYMCAFQDLGPLDPVLSHLNATASSYTICLRSILKSSSRLILRLTSALFFSDIQIKVNAPIISLLNYMLHPSHATLYKYCN